MRSTLLSLLLACVLLLLFYLYRADPQAFLHTPTPEKRPAMSTLPVFGEASGGSFQERSGKMFAMRELLGKVWVVDFFFTTCTGPCPLMTQRMADLQRDFTKEEDFRLVSITSDPAHDSPTVLKAYAERFKASKRWLFLTADMALTEAYAKQSLRVGLGTAPDMHSGYFILVDKLGKVRGYYDSADFAALRTLRADIQTLLKDKPST